MKTLYIDCGMGAAGDMLSAALLELLPDGDSFVAELNSIGIPNVEFIRESVEKCGIKGTHMSVKVFGEEECEEHSHGGHNHRHSDLHGIEHIINDHMNISDGIKRDVMGVYNIIAEAESAIHGVSIENIHFHEVGTMDAIADITAVCMLMERIAPDMIIASPIHVGSGQVKCAHGILPVPAPATALILKDVPIYGGKIKGELCTPTGAALLKYFVKKFGDMPTMSVKNIGYGMGRKDFEAANCVRAILGEAEGEADKITELSCNIDDMTPEAIGFATESLLVAGAADVYTIPIGMKKNRPATMLCVMCREDNKEKIISEIFRHTSTIGIRETVSNRYVLDRRVETISTPYGEIRKKISTGYGVRREKLEYEDIAEAARKTGKSIKEIEEEIM